MIIFMPFIKVGIHLYIFGLKNVFPLQCVITETEVVPLLMPVCSITSMQVLRHTLTLFTDAKFLHPPLISIFFIKAEQNLCNKLPEPKMKLPWLIVRTWSLILICQIFT